MSASAEQCAEQIKTALHSAARLDAPYRHWRLAETFPADMIDAINGLELAAPSWEGADGRRAWNNERVFVDPSMMAKEPKARALAEGLQSADVLAVIEDMCGLDLTGDFLRIEYCMDSQGFWLEPHTDLGVKHLTLLAYCARDEAAAGWGTSIYRDAEHWAGNMDGSFNNALMFVPADNTWHGFEPRKIDGLRRSLIINYVTPEWRARHELAFPDRPVPPRHQR